MAVQKEKEETRKSDRKADFKKMKEALLRFNPKHFLYYNSDLLLQADPEQISCFLKTIHHWRNERNEVSASLQQFCRELRSLVCSYWDEIFHAHPHIQLQIKQSFQIFLADSQLDFFIKYFDAEDLLFLFNQSGRELSQTESGHSLTFTLAASRNYFPKFSTILKSIPVDCFKKTDKMGNTPFHYALEKLFEVDIQALINNKPMPNESDISWKDSLQAINWMFQNNMEANQVNARNESPFDILIKHHKKTIAAFAKKNNQITHLEIEQLQPFAQLIVWFDQFVGLAHIKIKPENRLILASIIDKRVQILKEAITHDLLIVDLRDIVEAYTRKSETKFSPLLEKFGAIRNAQPTPTITPTADSHNSIGTYLGVAESEARSI